MMHPFKRILPVTSIIFGILLSGCATRNGVTVPGTGYTPPDTAQRAEYQSRNGLPPAGATPQTQGMASKVITEGTKQVIKDQVKTAIFTDDQLAAGQHVTIIIGTTAELRETPAKNLDAECEKMEKMTTALKSADPANSPVSAEWCKANLVGIVSIKFWSIPLVAGRFVTAIVTKDIRDKASFASGLGAFMFQSSADLVAVETFEHRQGFWITRVLCSQKQADFDECSKRYAIGVFQPGDGREITLDLKLVENGKKIDPITYQVTAN